MMNIYECHQHTTSNNHHFHDSVSDMLEKISKKPEIAMGANWRGTDEFFAGRPELLGEGHEFAATTDLIP